MPRGDGKRSGEKRNRTPMGSVPQPTHRQLAARQEAFDAQKDQSGETRPGSQRKGRSN